MFSSHNSFGIPSNLICEICKIVFPEPFKKSTTDRLGLKKEEMALPFVSEEVYQTRLPSQLSEFAAPSTAPQNDR